MLKNLADMFRSLFGRRTRKTVAAQRRRDFFNQFRKSRVEGLEGRAMMAAFTAGNLVVSRIGDGVTTLSSAANPISLAEFTTTGTAQTALNLVSLPSFATGGNNQGGFTDSGTATSNGMLNRSENGQYLSLVGIDAQLGTASVTGTSAATANRNVANIPNSGIVSVEARLTDAFTTNNARSAVTTNGDDLWIAGTGTTPTDGVRYVNAASGTPTTSTQIAAGNLRNAAIFSGVLFTSGTTSISTYNAPGSPPTAAATGTAITFTTGGMTTGSGSFIFLDRDGATGATNLNGLDTLYVVDAAAIEKYEWTGSGWTQRGSATFSSNLFSVTAAVNGGNVDLFATTNLASNNALLKATDATGFGGTLSIVAAGFTTLANAGTNFGFRGLALAPVAGAPTVTTPTSASVTDTTATLGGNVTMGTGITERGVVYSITTTNADPLIGGAGVVKVIEGGTTTGVFTTPVTGLTASSGYSFKAYAINANGTSYSSVATFTTNAPAAAHQAPSGTDNTITFNEDATHTFSAANFPFTDSDTPAQSLNRVRITTLPSVGTLTLGGSPVTAGDFVTEAAIPTLVYTPVANGAGTGYATFTFQVEDTGSTAGGGQILDATANTLTFNVTNINDAPAGTDKTVLATTGAGYTFAVADFGLTDPNDTPANALLAVTISTLPAVGSLTNNNIAVTAGQSIAVADITGGLLKFTPAGGATPATNYASFTFQVQDNGTTAGGGVDLDASANVLTINLTTAVVQGDIAFVGMNTQTHADGDWIAFVALSPIAPGATIYFTDNELAAVGDLVFNAGESYAKWAAPVGGLAAGTVVKIAAFDSATPVASIGTASVVAVAGSANRGLSGTADSVYAYNAANDATADTVTSFLGRINVGNAEDGLQPTSLTTATILFSGADDSAYYSGSTSNQSTFANYMAQLTNSANWTLVAGASGASVSPPDFTLAAPAPEINVQGNSVSIVDGDITPSTTDHTDFGAVGQGSAAIDRTFTIQNTGNLPLTLSGGPNFVSVTGGSNFSILTQPASGTIAAGGFTTFVVRMNPTTIATQTASVVVNSDDADEAVYNFDVTVTVTSTVAATTTSLVSVAPLSANVADAIVFAGTVVAGSGTATPVGTVEIRDGGPAGTLLASTATIGGTGVNGTFSINSSTVPAGTYSSIAAYFVNGPGFTSSNSATFGSPLAVTLANYVNYNTVGASYSQSFDQLVQTYPNTALSGVGPFQLTDPGFSSFPVPGWSFTKGGGTSANAVFRADNGSGNSGAAYSYGVAGTNPISDRALGSVASGGVFPRFGAVIRNTTSSALDTVTITFDTEQWRYGGSNVANTLTFEYKDGVAAGTGSLNDPTGFIADAALNVNSVQTSSGTAAALDGNLPANRTAGITKTLSGLNWLPGTELIIRWTDADNTGSDDGLAIDNFTLSAISQYPNGTVAFSSPTYNVTENGLTATVTVNRLGNTAGAIAVDYSTVAGGTAVAGTDYTTTSGTFNWIGGNNDPKVITIPITDNLTLNANRTINLALTNPTGGAVLLGNTTSVVTIREDEIAPLVLLNEIVINPPTDLDRPYEFVEARGTAGATLANLYVVQLDGRTASAGAVLLLSDLSNYSFGSNGLLTVSATTGGHPLAPATTHVPNSTMDIINGVSLLNSPQTVAIIFSTTPLTLGQDLDTNNDGTLDLPVGASVVDAVGWQENSAGTLDGVVYGGVQLTNGTVSASSGTPDAASRFYNNDNPLQLAAWFNGDLMPSGNNFETSYDPAKASANLPTGATVSPGSPNTGLSVAPNAGSSVAVEGNTGLTTFTFTISRAGDISTATAVTWTVAGAGTNPATAADFENGVFPSGLESFAINEASKQITIKVNGDSTIESDEQFSVTLSNPTNGATLASPIATSTITNDDYQALTPGQLVITGINTFNIDAFSFVPLVDLLPNATINFTDNAWDGLGFTGTSEGYIAYTAPAGGVLAGSKIIISVNGSTVSVAGGGTATQSGSFGLAASGENLFAFVGTSLLPNILFGLTTNSSYLSGGIVDPNTTYLPSTLTEGTSAVAPLATTGTVVNAQYTGIVTGTATALRDAVANKNNWTVETASVTTTLSTTNFTIDANVAPVITASQSFSVAESAASGSTVGTVAATDPNLGQTLSYTFVVAGTPNLVSGPFTISATTGQITVTGTLDFETTASYTPTVRVTDNGIPALSDDKTVTINVSDRSEGRVFIPTTLTAAAGGTLVVPVNLNVTEADGAAVSSAVVSLAYDAAKFTFSSINLTGGPLAGFTLDTSSSTPGNLIFTATGTAGAPIATGTTVTLANVTFNVAVGAAVGPSDLNLRAATNISDATPNLFLLSPLATDGSADSNVDGTVTIAAVNTLHVTNFTPTTTGFVITLSQPIVGTDLNLYDSSAATLGAADVTVVGSTTGPVRGSLIVNSAGTQVTFIRTGGALGVTTGDETYTVTLRSAANGFHKSNGDLLDGNADGTAGDNYTNSFVVSNTTGKIIVSVPDFARGFGQSVTVPNNATAPGIPLTISTGVNVASVNVIVAFDPTLLSISDFVLDSTLAGVSVNVNTGISGQIVIGIFHTTDLATAAGSTGTLTLGSLLATVPNTATYAVKQVLNISNLEVADNSGQANILPSIDNDGVHVSSFFGDTNANMGITAADASLTAQLGVLAGTGYSALQQVDPIIVSDINASNSITSQDASLIAQRGVLINVPQLPAPPTGITPPALSPLDPTLFLGNQTGNPGDEILVPFNVQIPAGESGSFQFNSFTAILQYDPTQLSFVDIDTTTFSNPSGSSNDWTLSANEVEPGIIVFSGFTSGASAAITNASGLRTFANLIFNVDVGAAGVSALNLRATYSSAVTSLEQAGSGLSLLLTPAPTNGVDAGVDATFTGPTVANNPPTAVNVTPNPVTIAENTAVPTNLLVGTINVTDDGQGTNTLSLTGADASFFTIVGTQLFLNAGTSLNFEVKPSYSVTVQVDDTAVGSTPDATTSFVLNVTNVNEAPTAVSFANTTTSIAENTPVPTNLLVADISVTDDALGTNVLSLSGTDAAFFTISGGQLFLVAGTSLNFEVKPSYSVTVEVNDAAVGGSPDASAVFTLNVTNVNEAPSFGAASYSFSLAENSATGTAVGSAPATDPDAGASLTYSLSGTGASNFSISSTGAITVAAGAVLNFEGLNTFNLNAGVTDGTNPVSVPVTITLTNVNEQPVFGLASYSFSVEEAAVAGTSVGNVSATDPEGVTLTAYTLTGTNSSFFAISSTGAITVASGATLNPNDVFNLTANVTDGTTASVGVPVTITVGAVNHAPTIAPQTFSIAENLANSSAVGTVIANDVDAGSILSFAITGASVPGAFSISPAGAITVANSSLLNFETTPSFTLTVTVTDNAVPVGPALSSSATITINLTNVNEAPTLAPQTFSVAENSANSTAVGTVLANDVDAVDTKTFAITSGNSSGAFAIDGSTGAITVANGLLLDFETLTSYPLTVSVTDAGLLSASNTVTINLTNVNEAPTLAPQTFSVAENAANGVAVGTVLANDVDAGDTKLFAITAGNTGGAFAISPSGAITVANGSLLNFEITPSYSLTVSVTDGGTLSASATITINVNNVNEAPSITSGGAFNVPENTTAVTTVTGADPDTIATLAYSIVGGADAAKFTIDQDLGLLAFLSAPNFESPTDVGANNVYDLIVRVSDGSLNSSNHPIAVTVTGVNEAPTIANQNLSVLDTVSNGHVVGTVLANDPDAGDTRTFAITAGNSAGAFAISPAGQITVLDASQLNYLVTPSYSLTVSVTDGGLLSNSATVTITVNHINSNPTNISLSTATIAENNLVNAVVGLLSTTDPDLPSDTHTYSLMTTGTGSTDHASFNISGNQLRANVSFDFETKTSYTVRVRSVDQGGAAVERVFTIFVTNVAETGNQAPSNIALSASTVAPGAATGTTVGFLSTSDPNSGNTHTYTLGGPNAAKFFIAANALRVASTVTDPVGFVNNITITSTDQGGLSFTKSFTVTVGTSPNVAPTFLTLNTFTIAENNLPNALVGLFSTTDANAGNTHTYTLVGGTGSTDNAAFTIPTSTNELRANVSFDFEAKSTYQIRVRSTDQGGLSVERSITIYVSNVVETGNQAPTNVLLSGLVIPPAAAGGTPVGTLASTDPNPGNTFTYTLGGTDAAKFVINGNVLQVAPAAVIGPVGTTYSITITTTDQGSLSFTKTFTITVANPVNVAPTALILSSSTIAENAGPNALIGTFTSTDANAGNTHTYSLVTGLGGDDNALFTIVNNQLFAVGSFDFEIKTSYKVRVRTTDQGGLFYDKAFTIFVTNVVGA